VARLECIIQEEPLQTFFKENCGIALAVNVNDAARLVRDMSWLLQNRGQAGCGICSTDGKMIHRRRAMGSVEAVFPLDDVFHDLPGTTAGAHVRYPTSGDASDEANLHPLRLRRWDKIRRRNRWWALAHNGTIPSALQYDHELSKDGHSFHSTTDSEILLRLIAGSDKPFVDAVIDTFRKMPTAYSLFVMNAEQAIIARDRFGVRPLSFARYKDGWLAASETDAFRAIPGSRFEREVEPGELIAWNLRTGKMKSVQYVKPCERFCVFEGHYFSKPGSFYRGVPHHHFRQKCGAQVYKENEAYFRDLMTQGQVIFVPDRKSVV
jgi:amidophosphoribosyltransferase